MMDPAIGAVDHGIGLSRQFIVQAALDQAPDDRFACCTIMHREAAGLGGETLPRHGPVHRLDDIAAGAKVAQRLLQPGL